MPIGAAKLHFEKLLEVMKKQRELLGEEGTRVKACIDAALEVHSPFTQQPSSAIASLNQIRNY